MACFQSSIIAGGGSLLLQDTVVVPTQYVHSGGAGGETQRGHSKLKIKAVQSELMEAGETILLPALTHPV